MAINVWGDYNPCNIAPASPQSVGSSTATFTWSTADNGDVVVTIAPGVGTTTALFRNTGFTGDVDQFKVLSGEGFATEENASKYFREKNNVDGESTYTLYRTGNYNLPSPCKIKYVHGALEWQTTVGETVHDNAYDNSSDYVYEYGTLCGSTLDAPEVFVNSNGEVSFETVAGADSYKAYVYKGGEFIKKCPVSSGDKVYNPFLSGEYAIYVRAFNSSTDAYSDFSNAAIWDATGVPSGDMPKSTVCDYILSEGTNEEALLSFYTDRATGNFYIAVRAGVNGDDSKTFFRDRRGMEIAGFKYDGETFTDYFNIVYSEDDVNGKLNTVYYTPRTDEGHIPEYGHTITFTNDWITWKTFNNGSEQNPFVNNLSFTYTYGANCNEIDDHVAATMGLSVVSTTTTSATLQIDVTDKNDYNEARAIRSLTIRDTEHSIAEQKAVLDGSNQMTLSDLKKNTTYNFTVKAIDSGGNVTEETINVPLTFDATENLAYKRTCSAGGAADPATQANDGNTGTHWGTYGLGDYGTKNYWTVTLDEAYVLDKMSLYAGGYGGDAAHKVTLQGKMREADAWSDIITDMTVAESTDHENVAINAAAKYLKVSAAADENWMFAINEFEVYGTAFAAPDAVTPTVVVTCPAKTVTSATLQIVATDKDDAGEDGTIRAINISGDNDFVTQKNVTLNGSNQITLSDLKDNTTYTFTVTVIDLAGNTTSENIVVVLPFNTELNLALNKTDVKGGYCQFSDHTPEGDAQQYPKANDGNPGTSYSAYGAPSADDAWWQVNLETIYDIAEIKINWASDYSTGYTLYGSLDGTNWYLIGKDAATEAGEKTTSVEASAQYIKVCSYKKANIVIKEVEVYASGFSTLEDSKPELTYAELLNATDEEVTIEVGGVDITTAPVQYYVVGIGDPQTVSATNNIITLTIVPNTHYDITVQAMDASGNKSNAKEFSFGSSGSASGIYVRGTFPHIGGWGTGEGDLKAEAQLTTTAQPGIDAVTISASAGTYTYKLYNATTSRWTDNNSSGVTDRSLTLANDVDVTIYATSEDFFYSNYDAFVLSGTAVGENKTLVWNAEHTKATWVGSVSAGTYQVSHAGGAHPFFSEAQTFDGDYVYGMFTLDLTKMTGTWGYVELAFADDADDNTSIISENNGRIANVTLNRTIEADNTWYTLCLPFDMSAEKVNEVFGASTIAELTGAEDRGTLIHLNFDYVDAIVAGKPYLFKAGETFNAGSSIEGVTIKNVTPIETGDELMKFIGTYDQIVLENQNQRFVADDDYLYSPADGGTTMGAFRCYFTIPGGSSAGAPGKRAKIVFGHQSPTGMDQITEQAAPAKFMFNGVLYIIRDGKTYNAQGQMIQ